jgi:carbamoyltransferase
MIILGINDGHHAGAALLADGRLVAAVSEERLTRRKREYGYPALAIAEVLRLAGISIADVDHIAVSTLSLPPSYFRTRRDTNFDIPDYLREQHEYWYPKIYEGQARSYAEVFADKVDQDTPYDFSLVAHEADGEGMLKARLKLIATRLGVAPERLSVHDHHTCHAYYGYYASPVRDRRVLVAAADGFGDGANGSLWVAEPGCPPEAVMRTANCNIGRLYRYMTLLLGMKPNDHEYKVMGLAPYASAYNAQAAYKIFAETLQVNGLDFTYGIKPKDHYFYFRDRLEGQRFDAIAWGLQTRVEELLEQWIGGAAQHLDCRDVVFSGGVAMNIKANKRICELDHIDSLFVAPGAGDESLPIGAAWVEAVRHGQAVAPLAHAYLGAAHDDEAVGRLLSDLPDGCTAQQVDDDDVAAVLVAGDVVARCCGPMEFGPRSLGNRSILADPRRREVVQVINDLIKHRDFWMPFAPSILAERADDYIINPKGIGARFMTVAFETSPLARADLAAAIHAYDSTVRPQLVVQSENPGYHSLIRAFERRTGVGGVLNTSFNLHGEPIVESPADAIHTFRRTGLPHLLVNRWLISKPAR